MGVTFTFEDVEEICRRLGLSVRKSKNNYVLEGTDPDGNFLRVSVHWKAGGRNLAKGTVNQIAKDLGFKDVADMRDFLQNRKRKR
ncbi:MAG: hypothetical protein K6T65_08755 [Peptococcaceae bacterium]|nr:hypothetical protein [Peptococcaceae bacterium]